MQAVGIAELVRLCFVAGRLYIYHRIVELLYGQRGVTDARCITGRCAVPYRTDCSREVLVRSNGPDVGRGSGQPLITWRHAATERQCIATISTSNSTRLVFWDSTLRR